MKENVNLNKEMDRFIQVINQGIGILENFLKAKLEKELSLPMQKIKWRELKNVGDTSQYMLQTKILLRNHFQIIVKNLKEFYFGVYFNRIVVLINKIFILNLYSLKPTPISETAVEQLQLDL